MNKYLTVIYRASRLLLLATLVAGLGGLLLQPWKHATVSAQQAQVTVVNAASFNPDKRVAPDSIAAAFGQFVTQNNQVFSAPSLPLPTTLGGVRLAINGVNAGLFFVAPSQINFLVPPGLQDAASATVTVTNSDNSTRTGTLTIQRAAVGVFSARATGTGVAAAQTILQGTTTFINVYNPDGSERMVSAGTAQQRNFLILYVTGLRNVPAQNPNDANGVAESVTVKLQGIPLRVDFAGPVSGLAGVEQINTQLPPEAAGLGSVEIEVSTATPASTSNKPTINLGPASLLPDVRVTPIAFDQTVTGELTIDDQIQQDGATKKTFFIDAYRFTTTQANTTVAIDMRTVGGSTLDPGVLLYRVSSGQLIEVGSDDQSGGIGNGRTENNNALLLAVCTTPGDYVIFASSASAQPNGTGAYSLRLAQNVMTQINYGANLTNVAITTADNRTSAGDYFDAYWFNGTVNDNADIRVLSTAFDSELILYQHDIGLGFPIASNDNENNTTTNSRITRRLDVTGIYIIWVTPFEPNRTGAYTLLLNRLSSLTGAAEAQAAAPGRRLHDLSGARRNSIGGRVAERGIQE